MDQFDQEPQVDISTPAVTEPQVDISSPTVKTNPSPSLDTAKNIAAKFSMSFPDMEHSEDEVLGFIMRGNEPELRKEAAAYRDRQLDVQQTAILNKMAHDQGRPFTLPESLLIQDMIKRKQTDPNSVLEEGYAQKFMSNLMQIAQDKPNGDLARAFRYNPEASNQDLTVGTDLKAKKEFATKLLEMSESALEHQSLLGWAGDQGKDLVTLGLYSQLKLRGLQGDTSAYHGLLGTNLDKQASDSYFQPFAQFTAKNQAIYDKLIKDNPSSAVTYFSALVGQSQGELVLNNFLPLANIDIAGLGVQGAIKAVRGQIFLRKAIRESLKASETVAEPGAVSEAVGNIEKAATEKAADQVVKSATNQLTPKDGLEDMLSAYRTGQANLMKDTRDMSQEGTTRLLDAAKRTWSQFTDLVNNMVQVDVTPVMDAVKYTLQKQLKEREKLFYRGIDNTLIDILPVKDEVKNVWYMETRMGRTGMELFDTKEEANGFIIGSKLGDAEAVQAKAGGWYVTKRRPLPISSIRDNLLETSTTRVPDSMINTFAGFLRTPEETQSYAELLNRKVATYGISNWHKLLKDNAVEINGMRSWIPGRNQKLKDWKRVMENAKYIDDSNPLQPKLGLNFETVGDLHDLYSSVLGRFPDEQEIAAAFANKRNYDILHELQKWRKFKDYSRLGIMSHNLVLPTPKQYLPDNTPPYTQMYKFNGAELNSLPKKRAGALVLDEEGVAKTADLSKFTGKWATKQKESLEQGKSRLIQLSNDSIKDGPFKHYPGVGEGRIEYVLAPSGKFESKKLDWNSLKVNPYSDSDSEHYVAQAIIKRDPITGQEYYHGDRILSAHSVRAEAKDIARKYDLIRQAIKRDNFDNASDLHQTFQLPHSFNELSEWFRTDVTSEGIPIGSKLSKFEPIRALPRGKMLLDLDRTMQDRIANFKDFSQDYRGTMHDMYDPYDIFSTENTGTKDSPLYNIIPVKNIDPLTSVQRSLNRAINGLYLDDYKVQAIEHWIRQAQPYMSASDADLKANPNYHFFRPSWKDNPETAGERAQLQVANQQIQNFLGVVDKTTSKINWVTQHLADSIYGYSPNNPVLFWTAEKLAQTHDPISFIRSMAFHAKLGLFAIPQLWVQSQNFANIYAIAGAKYAAPGSKAMMLRMLTKVNGNPEILEALDKMASNLQIPGSSRWRPGEWLEASKLLDYTGFEHVGGEYIMRDSTPYYDFIGSKIDSALHAGTMFFRGGEWTSRVGAWYTAYREFRDANPTGAISQTQARGILQRADLLTANMSRASSSAITKGIWSIPTQFLSYQLRVMELMTGKRLTSVEKMRMFGTYSALYGVPMAYGISGLPIGDVISKWAQEGGYTKGDSYVQTALSEGLPSLMIGLITGNYYNIGERYGVQGFQQLRDLMRSDPTVLKLLSGAAGSVVGSLLSGSIGQVVGGQYVADGWAKALHEAMAGEGDYTFKLEDALKPFQEIYAVNSAWRLYAAIHTGKWVTKDGSPITDVSAGNALFMTLSGLSPQEQVETQTKEWIRKQEKALQDFGVKKFEENTRRSWDSDNTPGQRQEYLSNAFNWLRVTGYPREDYGKAMAIAAKGWENQIDRVSRQFATKNVQEPRKGTAIEQYLKGLENK